MRMWMIDVRCLCRKHLLGEHSELHKHRHCFVKGHSIKGRKGQIEPESMKERHDVLAKEMVRRGYKHESEYVQPDLSRYELEGFTVDVKESLRELKGRCLDCGCLIDKAS